MSGTDSASIPIASVNPEQFTAAQLSQQEPCFQLGRLLVQIKGTAHWLAAEGAEVPDHDGTSAMPLFRMASLAQAQTGELSFLSNAKYRLQVLSTKASAVLVNTEDLEWLRAQWRQQPDLPALLTICVDNPYATFAQLSHSFDRTPRLAAGIHPTAIIGSGCQIHPDASIGPYVIIGDEVKIGQGTQIQTGASVGARTCIGPKCWIETHAVIAHDCELGADVRVHAHAVIGTEGFGFAFHQGQWHRIAQLGRVVIGDGSRIGASTTIDRGALEDTVVGKGVILDNQIQVAHNVRIGDHTAIAGNTVIAGSTHIGKQCIIGGNSAIAGHLTIVDGVTITGMAMITKSINHPGTYSSGTGFSENSHWKKMVANLRRLPEVPLKPLAKRLAVLQEEQACLKERLEALEKLKVHGEK